jgi:hypothetical protein
VAAVRQLIFGQLDSVQAAAFGQAFDAILAALEDSGEQEPDNSSGPLC